MGPRADSLQRFARGPEGQPPRWRRAPAGTGLRSRRRLAPTTSSVTRTDSRVQGFPADPPVRPARLTAHPADWQLRGASPLPHRPRSRSRALALRCRGRPKRCCGSLAFATALPGLRGRAEQRDHYPTRAISPGPTTRLKVWKVPLSTFASFPTRPGPATSATARCRHHPCGCADIGCGRSFLSWDCPKIAPPPSQRLEVHSRSMIRPKPSPSLREERANAPPCSALVLSQHLGGLLLRGGARVLQRAAGHGVHRVSTAAIRPGLSPAPSPSALPRDALLPFEVISMHSGDPPSRAARGGVSPTAQSPATTFTTSLAPSSSPVTAPSPSRRRAAPASWEVAFPS